MSETRGMIWAMKVSSALWDGDDPEAELRLRAKCRWEHMTRTAVILEWGDPRDWDSRRKPSAGGTEAVER